MRARARALRPSARGVHVLRRPSLPLPVRTARLTRVFIDAGSRETTRGPPRGPRASRADLVGDRLGVGRDQQVRGCRHFRLSTVSPARVLTRVSTSLPPFSPIEERWWFAEIIPLSYPPLLPSLRLGEGRVDRKMEGEGGSTERLVRHEIPWNSSPRVERMALGGH